LLNRICSSEKRSTIRLPRQPVIPGILLKIIGHGIFIRLLLRMRAAGCDAAENAEQYFTAAVHIGAKRYG
jgi:hypothetical protein